MDRLLSDDAESLVGRSRLDNVESGIFKRIDQDEPNERLVFDGENGTQTYFLEY